MGNMIEGDGMYIFPPLLSISSNGPLCQAEENNTVGFEKVIARDITSRVQFAISDYSSLPFTSDRREPTTQNINR
jgi:hypothetical protein